MAHTLIATNTLEQDYKKAGTKTCTHIWQVTDTTVGLPSLQALVGGGASLLSSHFFQGGGGGFTTTLGGGGVELRAAGGCSLLCFTGTFCQ